MTKAIQQSVKFPAPPEVLFEMYMDSKKHSESTGAPATISRQAGGKFTAFGGQLSGKTLAVVPNKMIVQSWRGPWKAEDLDSILVITFEKMDRGHASGSGAFECAESRPQRRFAGLGEILLGALEGIFEAE